MGLFPRLWELTQRQKAEEIMLAATNKHVLKISEISSTAVKKLEDDYFVNINDFEPKVFYRITDNWLELTIRFIVSEHKVRDVKDAISRDMLEGFDAEGIGIASATYDIVGLPPIRVEDSRNN